MLFFACLLACSGDPIESEGPAPVANEDTDTAAPVDEDGDGSLAADDCDDTNDAVHPGAEELCNGIDDDCDERVDIAATDGVPWYTDADEDGYGAGDAVTTACEGPLGTASTDGDCDDLNAATNPGATELCDAANVDEDCSGASDDEDPGVDEATWRTFYPDDDEDGYGDGNGAFVASCDRPAGYVSDGTDCAPDDPAIHPGMAEVCDADDVDENCSGTADDEDEDVDADGFTRFYLDADGDGVGVTDHVDTCDQPEGYAAETGDCNDAEAAAYPAATEICDDIDNDCDGAVDDGDGSVSDRPTWYRDDDEDGYGDPDSAFPRCDAPTGWISDGTDCDDAAGSIHPDAAEVCNEIGEDEDCDDLADDADPDCAL